VFKQIKQESKTPSEAVVSLLSIDGIFESSLLADAEFVNKIVDLFECIQEVGAMQTLHNLTKTLNLKG
jgi:fructuronate reductase